jgi:hypothetical protein
MVTLLQEPLAGLGSPEDIEQVKRNPLLRARDCLQHVLLDRNQLDTDALMSARLSMCYVELALRNYHSVLAATKTILEDIQVIMAQNNPESESVRRLHKRQAASAVMYAAEASCALGQLRDSLTFIAGDGHDGVLDELATSLSGVSLASASRNELAKRRLAKAQTIVRTSASTLSAAIGDVKTAKQLANSASAIEDLYSDDSERSMARRALIYTLLRENNPSSALTMLLS